MSKPNFEKMNLTVMPEHKVLSIETETEKKKYIELGVIEENRYDCIALYIPIKLENEIEHILEIFNANMYKLV
jgi:hypothetical protein